MELDNAPAVLGEVILVAGLAGWRDLDHDADVTRSDPRPFSLLPRVLADVLNALSDLEWMGLRLVLVHPVRCS